MTVEDAEEQEQRKEVILQFAHHVSDQLERKRNYGTAVVRGDMSPISLFNAVGDTFLIGVSVSERGNLHSQIGSHIL